MTTITLHLPDDLFNTPGQTPEQFVEEMRLAAAIHWYTRGELSHEMAAQVAGLDRTDFIDALSKARINAFHVDPEELKEELERGLQAHRQRVAAHPADTSQSAGPASRAGR